MKVKAAAKIYIVIVSHYCMVYGEIANFSGYIISTIEHGVERLQDYFDFCCSFCRSKIEMSKT